MYHGPSAARLGMQTARRGGAGATLAGTSSNGSMPGWAHYGWEFIAVATLLAALLALLRLLPALARPRGDGEDEGDAAAILPSLS